MQPRVPSRSSIASTERQSTTAGQADAFLPAPICARSGVLEEMKKVAGLASDVLAR